MKGFVSLSARIFTTLLFVATNLSTLGVARVSAQNTVEAKQPKASTEEQKVADGEILIKLKSSARPNIPSNLSPEFTGKESLNKLNKSVGTEKFEGVFKRSSTSEASELDGWYVAKLPNSGKQIDSKNNADAFKKLKNIADRFKDDENVEAAGLNSLSSAQAIPNDYFYNRGDQWDMAKINAPGAWDVSTGSSSMLVAVIDSGVQFSHEDLRSAMWDNPACSHSPEDYKEGYDFIANSCFQTDDYGHGTHVAGIIGAVGNNGYGIAGMNWTVKIMGLKVLNSQGLGSADNISKAIRFAADKGAKVANLSLSCDSCDPVVTQIEDDAVNYATSRGVTVVAAAGNGRRDANGNFLGRSDALNVAPANLDGVITVGSTDSNDAIAFDSNYGPRVDVSAPGVNIRSTTGSGPWCNVSGDNWYCSGSGTSFAAPHVAGLAALIKTINPNLTNEQVRQQLKRPESVTDLGASGRDSDYGWGRINANEAARRTSSRTLAPFLSNIKSRQQLSIASAAGSYTINGGVPGPNFTQYWIDIGQGRNPSSWTRIATSATQVDNGTLGSIPSQFFNGGTYTIKLTGYSALAVSPPDVTNKYFESSVFDVTLAVPPAPQPDTTPPSAPGNFSAASNTSSQVNLSWSASTDNVGVAGYRVFRTNAGTTPIATVTGTSYADTGLSAGTSYSYYVKAYDAAGNVSAPTNTVTVSTNYSSGGSDTIPPSVPTNVTATTVSSSQIRLNWSPSTDNVGVTSYSVMRNSIPVATVGSNVTTYTDSGLSANTTYTYSIIAGDGAGNGSQSSTVSATTLAAGADTTPPTTPAGLMAYAITASQIYVRWNASTDNVGVTGYRIYRNDKGLTPIATVSGSTTTYINSGLLSKTTYTYYVTAIDAAGNSSQLSSPISATTP